MSFMSHSYTVIVVPHYLLCSGDNDNINFCGILLGPIFGLFGIMMLCIKLFSNVTLVICGTPCVIGGNGGGKAMYAKA
jgi:hypothetical protein